MVAMRIGIAVDDVCLSPTDKTSTIFGFEHVTKKYFKARDLLLLGDGPRRLLWEQRMCILILLQVEILLPVFLLTIYSYPNT